MTARSVVCAAAEIAPIAVPAASATAAAVIFQRLFMPVSLSDRGHAPRPPPARRIDGPPVFGGMRHAAARAVKRLSAQRLNAAAGPALAQPSDAAASARALDGHDGGARRGGDLARRAVRP